MIKIAQQIPDEVGTWTAWTPQGYDNVSSFLIRLIDWGLLLMGSFAVIAVIYSGFMYISAGGDQALAEKAKKNLTWAIIGVVLIALSAVIVQIVNSIISTNTPA